MICCCHVLIAVIPLFGNFKKLFDTACNTVYNYIYLLCAYISQKYILPNQNGQHFVVFFNVHTSQHFLSCNYC
ncbi:hypothetical protein AAZV13_20G017300 [Glycine max]